MSNPFGTAEMAAGYAKARPPVHEKVLGMVRGRMGAVGRALDVGCGAGLSTKPLTGWCGECTGLEPAIAMLPYAAAAVPGARFVGGQAEALPFGAGVFDLLTAAGSLNYADLGRFFPEAARVLKPGGRLLVYDFSQGRSFRDSAALDEWFGEFMRLYPAPEGQARELNPGVLAGVSPLFRPAFGEDFEVGLTMSERAYVEYAMTETNVAAAESGGASRAAIRGWCEESLGRAFGGREREVIFRGYYACLER